MRARTALVAILALVGGVSTVLAVTQPVCPPEPAALAVLVQNLSADSSLTIGVSGDLVAADATCAGSGEVTYAGSFTCTGQGIVPCVTISNLRPGAWVTRLTVSVTGSDVQTQARRDVLIAGPPGTVGNFEVWTVYPRTFVVPDASEASLRARLAAAQAYTAANPGPALVTFSRTAFPGAQAPQTIDLAEAPCDPEPSRHVALCIGGSRLVVDALDNAARPGGVVWSVGGRALPLLRVYGSDDVLRGLVLAGSGSAAPPMQLDTVAMVGGSANRNRLERSIVRGPTAGDAVSIEGGAGATDADANVIDQCEITGARDKGVKVTTGAHATIQRSCVHDNANGGVQSTLLGHVLAIENVVQHNVPGPAGNGLSVGSNDPAEVSMLVTDGNIVRFAGARGLSVGDSALARFTNDYVADNQFAGAKVETTARGLTGAMPDARFRGVAFVCNHRAGVSGSCQPQTGDEGTPCGMDADCCDSTDGCCAADPECASPLRCGPTSFPRGVGGSSSAIVGHEVPRVNYGDATEPGRNAFAWNRQTLEGANLNLGVPHQDVSAEENQWEHCGTGAACDVATVTEKDLRLAEGVTVEIGQPGGPRAGTPVLVSVSPVRPRQGDLVRVRGQLFNAIEGTTCSDDTLPDDPCSAENPAVEAQNKRVNANRIRIIMTDGSILATVYPDAVTPTMLAFRMPFDCFTPLALQVAKLDPGEARLTATIPLCDAAGCDGQPAGLSCDDGDPSSTEDHCTGGATSVCRGTPSPCVGPCLTGARDAEGACVPQPASVACDDGNPCSVGDHCAGTADLCAPGPPLVCTGACATGSCNLTRGCVPRGAGALCRPPTTACDVVERCDGARTECPPDRFQSATVSCNDGNACSLGDHCSGTGSDCVAGGDRLRCDDGNPCTDDACSPDVGCLHAPNTAPCNDGDPCTSDSCQGGACHGTALPGYDLAVCEIGRPVVGPPCDASSLPATLTHFLARRTKQALLLLQRAAGTDRAKKQRRLAAAADKILGVMQARVARGVGRGEAGATCANAIDRVVRLQREVLSTLRALPTPA